MSTRPFRRWNESINTVGQRPSQAPRATVGVACVSITWIGGAACVLLHRTGGAFERPRRRTHAPRDSQVDEWWDLAVTLGAAVTREAATTPPTVNHTPAAVIMSPTCFERLAGGCRVGDHLDIRAVQWFTLEVALFKVANRRQSLTSGRWKPTRLFPR